jgi:predicted DNA binding CopG/RHH family protein
LTDFDDELEEVLDPVFEPRSEEKVTIRLPAEEVEVVKRLAKAKGLRPAALLREWVLEKLQHT